MEFFYKIFVNNEPPEKVGQIVVSSFEAKGFTLVSDKSKLNYLQPETSSLLDNNILSKALLISPQENNWCSISFSDEVWFSEAIDISNELSAKLDNAVLLALRDDAYGWGCYLFNKGILMDKFHTNPDSPTIREKETGWPDLLGPVSENQKQEYVGNPSLFAEILKVQVEKVDYYFSAGTHPHRTSVPHYDMLDLLSKVLSVPDKLVQTNYYSIFQETEEVSEWIHLIFTREMTLKEQEWYQVSGQGIFTPPWWVNEL